MSEAISGARIKAMRQARGLSQVGLAALLGVSNVTVNRWENDTALPQSATIARHVVIDEARRARPVASLDDVAGVDPTPGPDDLVIRSERGWTLAAAMRRLPPTQRQVIELRLAGLTAVEIAAVIDRSHGTVRNLQHRALVRLRGLLGVSDANQGAGDGS